MGGSRSEADHRGVLLVNMGSPDSPSVGDVRRYLDEFLMDGDVIDVPYVLRRFVVSLFVLPSRPRRSAKAYESIWWREGAPLVVLSRKVRALVQEGVDAPVGLAMRYGNPGIRKGLEELLDARGPEMREILLIPLYPHYAMSTVRSAVGAVRETLTRMKRDVRLDVLPPFYEDDLYINALAERMRGHLDRDFDHLLFSYHGLPLRHLRKTDPTGRHCLSSASCCDSPSPAHATCYRHQVMRTTVLVAARLGIPAGKHSVAFQSRMGKNKWLGPFTSDEIVRLAGSGVRRLLVVSPAFVTDCLETLEEIGVRGRKLFLDSGGKEFELVPCLNDHPAWIEALRAWCGGARVQSGVARVEASL